MVSENVPRPWTRHSPARRHVEMPTPTAIPASMRPAHVGRLLLALGLLVGAAAGAGLVVGFEPSRLPPALLDIAAYKLTFVAALGLIVAGALFLRRARRAARDDGVGAGGRGGAR